MHFGTFIGAESESLEAIIELAEAVEDAGVKTLDDPNEDEMGRMGVIDVGETWCTESKCIRSLLSASTRAGRARLDSSSLYSQVQELTPPPLPNPHSPPTLDRLLATTPTVLQNAGHLRQAT